MTEPRVPLPNSERVPAPQAQTVGRVPPDEPITVTLVLRRRADLDEATVVAGSADSATFADRYGAAPDDIALVSRVVTDAGAQVLDADPAARRVRASGTAAIFAGLFGTELTRVRSRHPNGGDVEHRHRTGGLSLPAALDGVVIAVLGLDDRPQARSHFRVAAAATSGYTPLQIATAYGMPANTDGTGQTIAIIELGGGFATSDLTTYFDGLGLPIPKVTAVGVDGAANQPGSDPSGADGEVLLDIEVAGAVAPGASQVVYFAPNTDAGFLDAITTATHASPPPTAISISWGQSEDTWTAQARTAMDQAFADAAALGITVTAAAGDSGSGDSATDGGAHVDFPAASPHVLACGGTRLTTDSSGAISSETVWNDGTSGGATGGGVSDTFALPSWQTGAGVPPNANSGATGRGVPDVSGDADPQTGYRVYVDGSAAVYGGTSAVAPLWAALTCRLAQSLGTKLGLLQPKLYTAAKAGQPAPGFHDITSGNNGSYSANVGWDACTGLGSPDGASLLTLLSGQRPS